MTRKDTILIAVVINAGLLAILFTTAVIYDTEKEIDYTGVSVPMADYKPTSAPAQGNSADQLIATGPSTTDEVDNVLKYYAEPTPIVTANAEADTDTQVPEPIAVQTNGDDDDLIEDSLKQQNFVEVKVKKGDVLEKIARAHKTSIASIKKLNHLENENLSIGQILKVPTKSAANTIAANTSHKETTSKANADATDEAVYYTIKKDDNPWKIAKQFNVKYDEILRLNHMSEEKARNLKIGDRIRVK